MFFEKSHALKLVEEGLERVQEFNYKLYKNELYQLSRNKLIKKLSKYKYIINHTCPK